MMKTINLYFMFIIIGCLFSCETLQKELITTPKNMEEATNEYNRVAKTYNYIVHDYNRVAAKTDLSMFNGFPQSFSKVSIEDTDEESIKYSISQGITVRQIKQDIEIMNTLAKIIQKNTVALRNNEILRDLQWEILEERVIKQLDKVPNTISYVAVTSANDPNGLLNKKGGYVCCVYFGYGATGIFPLDEKTVIEKGTDAGGAVEVFATEEEAKARCEYLAEYDGTLLYSGSYARLENIVIRTSALLSNSEQSELTNAIVNVLTVKK